MSILFTVSASLPSGSTPVTFSATGLPDGAVIDPNTGVVSGNPSRAQAGVATIHAVGADGSEASMLIPFVLTDVSNNGGSTVDYGQEISTLLTAYKQFMTQVPQTPLSIYNALSVYLAIVRILLLFPRDSYMALLSTDMAIYKDSYYAESTFFLGLSAFPSRQRDLLQTVYNAFRAVTNTPATKPNTDQLMAVTGCLPMVTYINSYGNNVYTAPNTQPTAPGSGNYAIPEQVTVNGGAIGLQVGGRAYEVGVESDTVISFVRDPDLSFPKNSTYFVESILHLSRVAGQISISKGIKFTKHAKADLATIGGDPTTISSTADTVIVPASATTSSITLKVCSFDAGTTWEIHGLDAD